jgi:Penicillin amidase
MLNFHLSWNWGQDLLRDVLEQAGLSDMVEEIFPFTAEYSHNLVTIIDAEDIQGTRFWSDETLMAQYHKSQGKTPKLTQAQLAQQKATEQLRLEQEATSKKEADRARILKQQQANEAERKRKLEEATK